MNGFAMQCKGTTNEKPSTLAEFTLQSSKNKPDFYDLSNVDGHSIGMSIKPIEGQFQQVDDPDLGQYNCGAPSCTFDSSKCPEELKVNDGQGGVACTSICAAIHNAQQREKHEHLKKIFENEDARSLVCCSSDQHYDRAPTDEEHVDRKKCLVTNWPKATDGQQYDQVFKSQCPDAYSWQFDDHKSKCSFLFHCAFTSGTSSTHRHISMQGGQLRDHVVSKRKRTIISCRCRGSGAKLKRTLISCRCQGSGATLKRNGKLHEDNTKTG
jgi:hypothetical protein